MSHSEQFQKLIIHINFNEVQWNKKWCQKQPDYKAKYSEDGFCYTFYACMTTFSFRSASNKSELNCSSHHI